MEKISQIKIAGTTYDIGTKLTKADGSLSFVGRSSDGNLCYDPNITGATGCLTLGTREGQSAVHLQCSPRDSRNNDELRITLPNFNGDDLYIRLTLGTEYSDPDLLLKLGSSVWRFSQDFTGTQKIATRTYVDSLMLDLATAIAAI